MSHRTFQEGQGSSLPNAVTNLSQIPFHSTVLAVRLHQTSFGFLDTPYMQRLHLFVVMTFGFAIAVGALSPTPL